MKTIFRVRLRPNNTPIERIDAEEFRLICEIDGLHPHPSGSYVDCVGYQIAVVDSTTIPTGTDPRCVVVCKETTLNEDELRAAIDAASSQGWRVLPPPHKAKNAVLQTGT